MDNRGDRAPTDLHSLRAAFGGPPPLPRRPEVVEEDRSLADRAIGLLIPLMIFLMMLSLTWFLLDIRFVFTERLDLNMRAFAFFFVLGIVALNRLKAERGAEGSGGYFGGMLFAVGVFTVASQVRGGGVAGGYLGNMVVSVGANVLVVAVIWAVTDRLTRDCCVDTSARGGEEGLLGGRWWRPAAFRGTTSDPAAADAIPTDERGPRLPRRHPANALFYLALPIMGLLALGQRLLPQGGSLLTSAGAVYVGVYTAAMLMLLLLSSYRGIRVYCQQRQIAFPTAIAAFWLGLGTVMAIVVFVLGLWGPVPRLPEAEGVRARTYDTSGRAVANRFDYHEYQRPGDGARGEQPAPGEGNESQGDGAGAQDPNAGEGPHQGQAPESSAASAGEGQASGGAAQSTNPSGGGAEGQEGQEQAGAEAQNTDGAAEANSRAQDAGAAQSPPAEVPMQQMMGAAPVLKWLGYGVLILLGLVFLYVLLHLAAAFFGRASGRHGSRFARLFDRLGRLFRRLTQVPRRPARRARVKIDRDIATCSRFHNPVNGPMGLREKIQYSYDAFCALAYDLGVPRDPDQTPFEFLARLPAPIEELRNEAGDLTHLYVAGSYSTLHIPDDALRVLQQFWQRYDRLRGRVLR